MRFVDFAGGVGWLLLSGAIWFGDYEPARWFVGLAFLFLGANSFKSGVDRG